MLLQKPESSEMALKALNSALWRTLLPTGLLAFALGTPTSAQAKDVFTQLRTVALPGDGGDPLGVFPDGRLVAVTPDAKVYFETAAGSGAFNQAGTLANADFSTYGVAFVDISPDGTQMAVGNNGGLAFNRYEVGVFDTNTFNGTWFGRLPKDQSGGVLHYSGAWVDNRNLAIAGGKFGTPSFVDVLDTQSANAVNPTLTRIVEGIGGASAGLALDADNNLVTGNGYKGDGPSETGTVKAFLANDWQAALQGNRNAVNFESEGIAIIRTLSANGMTFDNRGNLWIGGKDVFGGNPSNEQDFVAVVDAQAYLAVLGGGPQISGSSDSQSVTQIDPEASIDGQTFAARAVPASGEIIVRDTAKRLAFVYAAGDPTPAPAMPPFMFLIMGTAMAGSFSLFSRYQARSFA